MENKNTLAYKVGQLIGKTVLFCVAAIVICGTMALTIKVLQSLLWWIF